MTKERARRADEHRITLDQLRVLVSVIEAGGFQSASRQVHRTQSAVTQSLKKLEEILGCRLLERRQGHVLGLTPEGERFLPAAREILARVSDALVAVQRPELKGRIALGVPDDFRIADLPDAISRCLELNRKLRIQVISALSAELSEVMRRGELDMAILKQTASYNPLAGELDARSLICGLLRAEPLHWVYQRRVAFRDLDEIPLVAFPDGCVYRRAALSALERRKINVLLIHKCILRECPQRGFSRPGHRRTAIRRGRRRPFRPYSKRWLSQPSTRPFDIDVSVARGRL